MRDWGRIDLSIETRDAAAAIAADDTHAFEITDPAARDAYANVELARRVQLHARARLKEAVRIAHDDAGVSDIFLSYPLDVDLALLRRMYLHDGDAPSTPNEVLPWEDVDRGIINLVWTINATLPGIETISSCEGHPDRRIDPEPCWHVALVLQPADAEVGIERGGPHPDGWLSIEWLTWFVTSDLARAGYDIDMDVHAPAPYLNEPGRALTFWIEAPVTSADRTTISPDEFGRALMSAWEEVGFDPSAVPRDGDAAARYSTTPSRGT